MTARPYYGSGSIIRTDEASAAEAEGRKRKTGTRRTVDYGCTNAKWLAERLCQRSAYDEKPMRPALNEVINVNRMLKFQKLKADVTSFSVSNKSLSVSYNQICPYIN
jgi:hypothetical protein